MDWLRQITPEGAYLVADGDVEETYDEEIVCHVRDDSNVAYVIKEDE